MDKKMCKPMINFAVCVLITLACAGLASIVVSGFGSVAIETGFIEPEHSLAANGLPVRIAYKLYRPKLSSSVPAPAVLAMHGYQNDKETNAAFCIELARRGIVVLSVDLYGHGESSPGFRGRGWGQYSIKNLEKPLSGPQRFLTMITFSILDFFRPEIAAGVADSSMGGKSAWLFLRNLPYVDESRMGLTGHSMGTWASWSVAADFPEHRAIVLQCGEVIPLTHYDSENITFNNVLLLQARYDEFENFRDYGLHILGLEKTPVRYHDFMGQDEPVEWNRTYGSFDDGSARRMELLQTNHRLVTHDKHGMTASMEWFTAALGVTSSFAASNHIYMLKEILVLLAMLSALVSMLPLFLILTQFKFFAPLAIPLAEKPKTLSLKKRRTAAIIAILVSALTFPFLTQLGHGLLPLPENVFRMTIGNGFITWLTFLMLVSLCMLLYWFKKGAGKQDGWTASDLGLAEKTIPRAILAAFILTGSMYALLCISVAIFKLDFRFIWPFFRPFTPVRFGQFLLYLPFYVAFFTVNAGVRLYGQMRLPEIAQGKPSQPILTQLAWWG